MRARFGAALSVDVGKDVAGENGVGELDAAVFAPALKKPSARPTDSSSVSGRARPVSQPLSTTSPSAGRGTRTSSTFTVSPPARRKCASQASPGADRPWPAKCSSVRPDHASSRASLDAASPAVSYANGPSLFMSAWPSARAGGKLPSGPTTTSGGTTGRPNASELRGERSLRLRARLTPPTGVMPLVTR